MGRHCSECNDIYCNVNRALRDAIKCGHDQCVKRLIEVGTDVNEHGERSNSPLIYAVLHERQNCVDQLIKAGADVSRQNKNGDTAAICAALRGNVTCLELLIEAGADVNTQNENDNTALIHAVRFRECTRLLIEAGADVNAVNRWGHTALILAAMRGHAECLKLLIEAGADVNFVDRHKHTALMCTIRNGSDIGCVRLLLQAGIKINIIDTQGENALFSCILNLGSVNHGIRRRSRQPDSVVKDICMLLFAAGETINGTRVRGLDSCGCLIGAAVPKYLLELKDLKMNLKHMCRETIRKHLINIDPHQHLFRRIPQLGLPSSVVKYLLYDVSLDDDKQLTKQMK